MEHARTQRIAHRWIGELVEVETTSRVAASCHWGRLQAPWK